MKNKLPNIDPLADFEKATEDLHKIAEENSKPVAKKYPLTFSFLGLIGFLLVLYGFERTLDAIPIFKDNPFTILVLGLLILLVTGGTFKWLLNKKTD